MDRLIFHNDRIVDVAEARIAPTVAGALYGWGVFTTARIYDGAVFAFERHWERLARNAEKARVPLPVSADEAREAVGGLIKAGSIRDGRARITILKGDAGAWRAEEGRESELLIFTLSDEPRPQTEVAITMSPYRLLSSGPLAGVKRTAMLENLLALDEARSRGFTEAVMLNERGEIVSATAANIFWIEGDEVYTPSIATGCIAGVTRSFVYEIARRMKIHLVEGGFTVQRLLDAREVFLTSTVREIAHVSSFDMKEYGRRQARMTRLIGREFQKLTRDARIT
jgi:branched-subunit amino acid aminotransferase/4-amino-4-deoxychorismate lyase